MYLLLIQDELTDNDVGVRTHKTLAQAKADAEEIDDDEYIVTILQQDKNGMFKQVAQAGTIEKAPRKLVWR